MLRLTVDECIDWVDEINSAARVPAHVAKVLADAECTLLDEVDRLKAELAGKPDDTVRIFKMVYGIDNAVHVPAYVAKILADKVHNLQNEVHRLKLELEARRNSG